jgi:hypothetical protein
MMEIASTSYRLGSGRRHPQLADQLEHVGAETIVVGERVAGLVDPVVDTATEVLDEGTESRRFTLPTAK